MNRLIDEQKVRDAALRHSVNDIVKYNSFFQGVNFAINEMPFLFCEFRDFCMEFELYGQRYTPIKKTTQQLFDLWVEERNKKKEPE